MPADRPAPCRERRGVDLAVLALVAAGYVAVRLVWAPTGLVRAHLTDLLAGVALPSVMALVLDGWAARTPWWRTLGGKLALVLSAALVWEVLVPLFDARSTADPLDVLAYVAGALLHHAALGRGVSARPTGR